MVLNIRQTTPSARSIRSTSLKSVRSVAFASESSRSADDCKSYSSQSKLATSRLPPRQDEIYRIINGKDNIVFFQVL